MVDCYPDQFSILIWVYLSEINIVFVNSSLNRTPCFLSLYGQAKVGRITVCDGSGCRLDLWKQAKVSLGPHIIHLLLNYLGCSDYGN